MVNDTIADLLTRIRNANLNKDQEVSLPTTKMCEGICNILDYRVAQEGEKPYKTLSVFLKYDSEGNRVISGIKRISKPGLRVTATVEELPKVLNGLGVAIISTSKGLLTDREARKANIGGEVLLYVW